jgi:gamma-glutamylcyclotransferase (GGCT)/AIG2-like uncharacterized protein YtfP
MSAGSLLFVYGTLRQGSAHPMARYLASRARFLARASTAGRLYDLGRYPGMTVAAQGERVWGDLFEMNDPPRILERLDAYEGCCPDASMACGFQRHLVQVVTEDGQAHMAWVYMYHAEVREEMRLANGRYPHPMESSSGG